MQLAAIESLLTAGKLHLRMRNGNLWALRRNGRTKLWTTRPDWFRIPVKAGLRVYDEITHESTIVPAPEGNGFVLI